MGEVGLKKGEEKKHELMRKNSDTNSSIFFYFLTITVVRNRITIKQFGQKNKPLAQSII
jgi:hypothetical protein